MIIDYGAIKDAWLRRLASGSERPLTTRLLESATGFRDTPSRTAPRQTSVRFEGFPSRRSHPGSPNHCARAHSAAAASGVSGAPRCCPVERQSTLGERSLGQA
jgi:hypothetical protein